MPWGERLRTREEDAGVSRRLFYGLLERESGEQIDDGDVEAQKRD